MVSIGLGGLAAAASTSTVGDDPNAKDLAFLGTHANIHSSGTAITVLATRGALAVAKSTGGAGGVIGAAGLEAEADVAGLNQASVTAGATVGTSLAKVGNLSVRAIDTSVASATAEVISGGAFSARGSKSTSNATPTVEAFIGAGVHIVLGDSAGSSLTVEALSNAAEADALSKSAGGGGIDIGAPSANATSAPTVHAYLGSGSTVVAGGSVTVNAQSSSLASGSR